MGSRSVLGAVLLASFLWFMFIGILAHQNNRTVVTISSSQSFKNLKPIESRKRDHHHDSDLNFVSKRRVPTGPDPIHNRYICC